MWKYNIGDKVQYKDYEDRYPDAVIKEGIIKDIDGGCCSLHNSYLINDEWHPESNIDIII